MVPKEIKSNMVETINCKMENIRESTSSIIEQLIELRASVEEVMYLEYLIDEYFQS